MKIPSPADEKDICKEIIVRALGNLDKLSVEASFNNAVRNFRERPEGCFELYQRVLWSLPHVNRVFPGLQVKSREAVDLALLVGPDPFSLPKWIIDRIKPLLGENGLSNILKRKTWVRINTLRGCREATINKISERNYKFKVDDDVDFLLEWISPKISSTKEFRNGLLIPQDKSSVFVIRALDPKPGETILEIGSAPGTKTSLIQQFTENQAYVIGVDTSSHRIEVERKLLKRWGVKNVDLVLADGANVSLRNVDKILIDAPCTNSGTINVDPSIPLRLTKEELMKLKRIQKEILKKRNDPGSPRGLLDLFPLS
ncbi:methyltransferase domain-containing protein [Metallosphaera hakonensis]|uniref:methyltransferase domain-containing protein n=1 Tax=Metallosphaera hakonensis TaxID=79601 RepID=UPI000A68E87E|nr:RsmB/NOP family class I SAM-dependent RNA methyltransferase [Metallosphaera hakonensis]